MCSSVPRPQSLGASGKAIACRHRRINRWLQCLQRAGRRHCWGHYVLGRTALLKQQSDLYSLIKLAAREAVNSILTPQLAELQQQIEHTTASVNVLTKDIEHSHKSIQSNTVKFDTLQATVRASKQQANDLPRQVEELTSKMVQMEDRSRRSNVRLVGLKEGAEELDATGFLISNLLRFPHWEIGQFA